MKSRVALTDLELRTDAAAETLVLTKDALETIYSHRQTGRDATEAGGMLFAVIESGWIIVRLASAPHHLDRRTRTGFEPHLREQQRAIQRQYRRGLHFIGEWHTHPESRPAPSVQDLRSMERCFATSKHSLQSFVMVIMGTAKWPRCLWVSLHRDSTPVLLYPKTQSRRSSLWIWK